MATTEGQLDDSDPGSGNLPDGWQQVLGEVRRDLTARLGMYLVGISLAVATFATLDSNLSVVTGGALENYAIGEAFPVLENPVRTPPPDELEPYAPPAFVEGGTWDHPLGTDQAGRDYLSRIVYGTRVSMTVGVFATLLGLTGGVTIGSIAGYYGGWIDDALMRFVEIIYSIPGLVLVIVFTMFVSGGNPDIQYALLGVAIISIPTFARIIRSRVLSVREMEYIEAARASGVRDRNIILRHVIPNSFAPVLIYATLQIGVVILVVASLSYLGYGAQPPTPDWGQMLNHAHGRVHSNPWMSVWPGVAILLTIMGFNLVGDGLQDALDPRIRN